VASCVLVNINHTSNIPVASQGMVRSASSSGFAAVLMVRVALQQTRQVNRSTTQRQHKAYGQQDRWIEWHVSLTLP
jgi:hypothetical protein